MDSKVLYAGILGVLLFTIALLRLSSSSPNHRQSHGDASDEPRRHTEPGPVKSLLLFVYSCFLKPHLARTEGTQQDALEYFYSSQSNIYDSTRATLLKGREDMLALVAAQLRFKKAARRQKQGEDGGRKAKPIWVDVCASCLMLLLFVSLSLTTLSHHRR